MSSTKRLSQAEFTKTASSSAVDARVPVSQGCELLNVEALVFDLDGTLIDSRADIAAAANFALVQSGRQALTEDTIASFVGDGALALIQRASGLAAEAPELRELHISFLDYYTRHATVNTRLYPGVRQVLNTLQQSTWPLALCTNKPRATTERVLAELKLDAYFPLVTAGDDFKEKKPHPTPLLHIARELGLPAARLVMIGDGPQDVECGRRAGACTVGVTYGIKDANEMLAARPQYVIDAFPQLLALLPSTSNS